MAFLAFSPQFYLVFSKSLNYKKYKFCYKVLLPLVNQAGNPLGQFDGYDAEVLTFKGGEVCTLKSIVATAATDKAAYDVFDGYINPNKRVVATKTLTSGSRPLMLADDGISGYGTLFGSVVGGVVGQVSTGGAVLGPHTATGHRST